MNEDAREVPYNDLRPDLILDAVESAGWRCDGHLLVLNSYENRVYQIGLEDHPPVVVKFYRPGRWSDAAIIEEHRFSRELADLEIDAVAPFAVGERTLHEYRGFRFAVYPRRGGRTPDLENPDILERLGRFLGRMHAAASVCSFDHRPGLDARSFGLEPGRYLIESGWVPSAYSQDYREVLERLLFLIDAGFDRAAPWRPIRLHGDCHGGNMLWTDTGPCFVDFDDARMGPAIQDLWMCLSGGREERTLQLQSLLSGYRQFHDFQPRQLHLVEPLRTLRMIHHTAWIARRWHDPAFPLAFPWFAEGRFWENHLLALGEQIPLMEEPPLEVMQ
ncbi:MAG: serine/threonine protein kinase [Magnetococcales bacterium]|nr:serine/threonine protein kinase [Magnetococcales bacterium]